MDETNATRPNARKAPGTATTARLRAAFGGLAAIGVASALFIGGTDLIGRMDWGHGRERAALLFASLLMIPVLLRFGRRSLGATPRHLSAVLLAVACVLLVRDGAAFVHGLERPHPNDIGATTIRAARALARGLNPYEQPIDPKPELLPERYLEFTGYKYMPLMAVSYLPLTVSHGARGLLATNALFHLATVLLVFLLGRRLASREVGALAACLALAIPFARFELFVQGVTDLSAVVPLMAALLFVDRRPFATGLLVGLSTSTKLLPGALFVACCLPSEGRRAYLLGGVLGLLPALAFLLAGPQAFANNIVLFNVLRPTDTTSWLHYAPAGLRTPAGAALALTLLASAVWAWRARPSLLDRIALACGCTLVALITGPISHRNYLLWWLPLMALLVARAAISLRQPGEAAVSTG